MKMTVQKAAERGGSDYGWLKPNYYFSFAGYHNPQKINFGLLRVLNDDFIDGGGAFDTHPHENMEIVTIPLSGSLKHEDSTGGSGTITAGDVQIMSAGTGVQHSEANASYTEPVNLFQVWIFPKVRNIAPRYDQRKFEIEDRKDKWQVVVSPLEAEKALWINQDARFSLANLSKGKTLEYKNGFKGNGVYLVVVQGSIEINGQKFEYRDAIGISETNNFTVTASEDAELMAIEVPMD